MTLIVTPATWSPDADRTPTPPTNPAVAAVLRHRRTGVKVLVGIASVALIVVLAAAERRLVGTSASIFGQLRLGWIAAAVAAQVLSIMALARMHRRLVGVSGVWLSNRSALAVVYASNAISGSVPMAGSELGTAYTFRQYQHRGVKKLTAAWVLTIAGVISSVTFALIVALSAAASGNLVATVAGLAGTAAMLGAVILLLFALRNVLLRRRLTHDAAWALRALQRLVRRPVGDTEAAVTAALQHLTSLRLHRRDWTTVVLSASVNWLADISCLVLAIKAIGQPVPWALLIPAWAAGAAASSLSVTPGGLGVVEAALAAALVSAGLHSSAALGAVLVYRAITFWLALGVGWTVYLVQQHQGGDGPVPKELPARAPTVPETDGWATAPAQVPRHQRHPVRRKCRHRRQPNVLVSLPGREPGPPAGRESLVEVVR
jgi:uncharacterized protein (TIRG00374 family)